MSNDSDKRHTHVAQVMPSNWDMKPHSIATEIREFLKTIKDEGTEIDSGGGNGAADLWAKVDGVEYLIQVRRSKAEG